MSRTYRTMVVVFLLLMTSGLLPGTSRAELDDISDQIAIYEKQLEEGSRSTQVLWNLVWLYRDAGGRENLLKEKSILEQLLNGRFTSERLWDEYFVVLEDLNASVSKVAAEQEGGSESPFALEILSRHALSKGNFDDAEVHLRKLLPQTRHSVELARLLAQTYVRQSKFEQARKLYEDLLRQHPRQNDLYEDLARICLIENDPKCARQVIDRMIESPRGKPNYEAGARFFFDEGRYDEAVGYLKLAKQNRFYNADLLTLGLKIALLREDYQGYVDNVMETMVLELYSWERMEENLRELDTCMECLQGIRATLLQPRYDTNPTAQAFLALVEYYTGEVETSKDTFIHALKLTKVPQDIVSSYIRVLRTEGYPKLGLQVLEAYRKTLQTYGYGEYWNARWESIRLMLATEEYTAARRSILDALKHPQDLPVVGGFQFTKLSLEILALQTGLREPRLNIELEQQFAEINTALDAKALAAARKEAETNYFVGSDLWEAYAAILEEIGGISSSYEGAFKQLLDMAATRRYFQFRRQAAQVESLFITGPLADDFSRLNRRISRMGGFDPEVMGSNEVAEVLAETLERFHQTLKDRLKYLKVDYLLLRGKHGDVKELLADLNKNGQETDTADWALRNSILDIFLQKPEVAVESLREQVLRHSDSEHGTVAVFLLDLTKRYGMDEPAMLADLVQAWWQFIFNHHDAAREKLEEIVRLTGESPIRSDALLLLATVQLAQDDNVAAANNLSTYLEAFPLAPARGFARFLMALSGRQRGQDGEEELAALEKEGQISPWYLWTRNLVETSRPDASLSGLYFR